MCIDGGQTRTDPYGECHMHAMRPLDLFPEESACISGNVSTLDSALEIICMGGITGAITWPRNSASSHAWELAGSAGVVASAAFLAW